MRVRQVLVTVLVTGMLLAGCGSQTDSAEPSGLSSADDSSSLQDLEGFGEAPDELADDGLGADEDATRDMADAALCDTAQDWSGARQLVGSAGLITGPVVSVRSAPDEPGSPTFINLGADYPDPSRVTVVIWGDDLDNFDAPPADAYSDETLCVFGDVRDYQGAVQIPVAEPRSIVVDPS